MLTYYNLGSTMELNEIVVAGSHDAGITGGAANVQTQDLDIHDQAIAGVRLFDIRIAATSGSHPLLKTYHGAKIDPSEKSIRGAFGEGLTKILSDASNFVTKNTTEFLILKFDHCSKWEQIASACVHLLGNSIYKGSGNLNKKTLDDLKGKVIVVFAEDGLKEVRKNYPVGSGILGIRNLSSKGKAYDVNFDGMQYYGKGGTDVKKPSKKLEQNIAKQSKLMKAGGSSGNPDIIGMMYWTTTGIFESIKNRNNTMWTGTNVAALQKLWLNGLAESIQTRIAKHVDPTSFASGTILKSFMPNIVMIDFADAAKCKTIYDLNHVGATELVKASVALEEEIEELEKKYNAMKKR